jgi:hypothetical protein
MLLGTLCLAILACNSDSTTPLPACTSPVTVSVSSGPTPQFSWSPACAVSQLIVFTPPALGAAETVWWYISSPTADIRPPVQFGATPAGASEITAAQPLGPDRNFSVVVSDAQGNVLGVGQRIP